MIGTIHRTLEAENENRTCAIAGAIKRVKGVKTEIKVPELANSVPHLHIEWDHAAAGKTPEDVVKALREGRPSIEVRPGSDKNLVVAVWMLQPGEDRVVARRLKQVLNG